MRQVRTAYVVGLFGSGRWYLNALILRNIGERAKYFRDTFEIHSGPTSMIYSGHATLKYISRGQALPAVARLILESVAAGFADLIFIYRHPLDSLLTNWIWWREYIRTGRIISGISEVYSDVGKLCADLEANFEEFKAFASGDARFFAGTPGPPPGDRFLSFSEFVEETELFLQSATLALRFEDFAAEPMREFSKVLSLLLLDLNGNYSCVEPPKSKPYRHLAVQEKSPQFRMFIAELDAETKKRSERIGYQLCR